MCLFTHTHTHIYIHHLENYKVILDALKIGVIENHEYMVTIITVVIGTNVFKLRLNIKDVLLCQIFKFKFFILQNKNSDFCAPLTSFDWNEVDPNLIGTSSIDTTCTIWGLETTQVKTYP